MSSTAKSAQGSTLYIGELDADSPDAATVSGITKAVNPVVTATGHGLPEGSIVLFASVGGMTQINGKYACVGVIDANSFYAYGIDSTEYTTYTSGGTATTKRVALGKRAGLDLIAEGFNLFNSVNYDVNSVQSGQFTSGPTIANPRAAAVPNPRYGQYTATLPPREIQLGARLTF